MTEVQAGAAGFVVDLQIEVPEELAGAVGVDWEKLSHAAAVAAMEAGFRAPAEMTLVIADDAHVQELNRTYRQVDAPTDVLAFAIEEADGPFVLPDLPEEEGPAYIGDVIISLPQASRQAVETGHPVQSELCLLAVHGTLHLLGFDHGEPQERREMWTVQLATLRRLGCADAAPEDAF